MSKFDYIGEICGMAEVLYKCGECCTAGAGDIALLKKQADTTARTVMSAVLSEFVTPLGRSDIGLCAAALRRAILATPRSVGGRYAEPCRHLAGAIRECARALRGRGKCDGGFEAYIGASVLPDDAAPEAIRRWHTALCSCYETLLCALLNSL